MDRIRPLHLWLAGVLFAGLVLLGSLASAQEEVASAIRRYKAYEASTGYYEEYEVLPRRQRPLIGVPNIREGIFPYSPTVARVRSRTHLADSHQGIRFYKGRQCVSCHPTAALDIHTTRANLTCRQCHGGEPIASIDYYWSPMNPIRRHAYVCAKCHEGATASYAAYLVHAPNPALSSTLREFPILAYAFWIMVAIAVGTFVLFLPHTILWGIRELFTKKKTKEKKTSEPDSQNAD
jgi:hypothetical protein